LADEKSLIVLTHKKDLPNFTWQCFYVVASQGEPS